MTISNHGDDSARIDLDQLINEFIHMVSEDAPDLSTDPNVKRVKVIRVNEYDCPGCNFDLDNM